MTSLRIMRSAMWGTLAGGMIGFIGSKVAPLIFLKILYPWVMLLMIVFGSRGAILDNFILVEVLGSALLGAGIGAIIASRRLTPIPPGYCAECDYNLTGNESGVCPECGTEIGKP